jgi:hypothetical protein
MYKPKKHLRLDPLTAMPVNSDLKNVLAEAEKAKGCTVELPWSSERTNKTYALTVRCEFNGGEPIWTLYEGVGAQSRALWSSPFADIELLKDVLALSLPDTLEKAELPAHLLPQAEKEEKKERPAETAPQPPTPQPVQVPPNPYYPYPPPGYAPYPPPGGYYPYPYPYPPYPPGYPPPYDPNQHQTYPPGTLPTFQQPYPTYPYAAPPNAPAPPAQADPYQRANTLPVQPGPPVVPEQRTVPPPEVKPPDLTQRGPNLLLGQYLVDAGMMPEQTLYAALRMQEFVKAGSFTPSQAAEAVRRAHARGGALDPALDNGPIKPSGEQTVYRPPIGQILVEAGIIGSSALKAALKFQELVRTGKLSEDDACKLLYDQHFGANESEDREEEDSPRVNRVLRVLVKTSVISNADLVAARNVRFKSGGVVSKILLSSGKIDKETFVAAEECEPFVTDEKVSVQDASKILLHCKEKRMKFRDAVRELGIRLV